VIGPKRDIPAPDMYTNATIMGWMADEYNQIKREQLPSVITGKPVHLGGSLGREAATGQGALYVLQQWTHRQNIQSKKTTVAVQGFGNAGYQFARLAQQAGFRIVALSDSKGAVYLKKVLMSIKLCIINGHCASLKRCCIVMLPCVKRRNIKHLAMKNCLN